MEPVTREYYEQNAEQYVAETVHLDVRHLYAPFLDHVPLHGHILDAGCGSGRDTLYFLQNGYEVTAFDGIWACASLLHMPHEALPAVCRKLRCALKPNGVLYCSFKEGPEYWTDAKGRFFVGMTEPNV